MHFKVEEHVIIPVAGCQLAARIWLPDDAVQVPAILEYIPYGKRSGTRQRDDPMHGYFAAQGYAVLRVDMRGCGESEGHMADEYLEQEQDDALDVIAWAAIQPWCNGAVGMMGKSWGGFNCLQVAARKPPALRAIISICSTDDRYADDVHYMGGCLLNDNLWWGSIMQAYQARPPDPELMGPSWREAWLERIDSLPFFPHLWLMHQRRDAYWAHGSVCEDFSAIQCPILAVGGWIDSYTNAILRMLEGLPDVKAIIGPWGHTYPQDGAPGPAIGFLQEATAFWDAHLKGTSDYSEQPVLRAYVEDYCPPVGTRTETPGHWVAESSWPNPHIQTRCLHLHADGSLLEEAGPDAEVAICSPCSTGKAAGEWMGCGCPGELPTDQRLDDGGSLVFKTEPLGQDLILLGAPQLDLELSADEPVAQLCVRLCDVASSAAASRISYQVLNLTHLDSHAAPEPIIPGKRYTVGIKLSACGHCFPKGHRLSIAVSTAYWPTVWPPPRLATVTLYLRSCQLSLPVRQSRESDSGLMFLPPAHGPFAPVTQLDAGSVQRRSVQDHVSGVNTYVTDAVGGIFGEGILRFNDIDTEVAHSLRRKLSIRDDEPLSAEYKLDQTFEMGREGWRTKVVTHSQLTADEDNFYLKCSLVVSLNGEEVRKRQWKEAVKRDLC